LFRQKQSLLEAKKKQEKNSINLKRFRLIFSLNGFSFIAATTTTSTAITSK